MVGSPATVLGHCHSRAVACGFSRDKQWSTVGSKLADVWECSVR